MSAQKYMIVAAFVVVSLLAVNCVSDNGVDTQASNLKSNHLIIGYRLPGDRVVANQNIVKGSSWMKVQTLERTFNTTYNQRITLVEAWDQKTNGKGARASLVRGGPGHNNVTLKFKSQRGQGINFVVIVYAR